MDKGSDRSNTGQVSKVSRGKERRLEKKSENQVQNKSIKKALQLMKRALQLMNEVNEGGTTRTIIGPKTKRPFQRPLPRVTCNFCHKPGHFKRDCRMANGLCLACGKEGHVIRNCPFRRVGNMAPVRPARPAPALPAPPPRRNPEPVDLRVPFPSQQNDRQQRGVKTGADQSGGQDYIMAAEASDSAAEREDQCPDPEP